MNDRYDPKARFGIGIGEAAEGPRAAIADAPPLPVIDFAAVGQSSPVPVNVRGSGLPKADAIVMTWADAEWAALEHVFGSAGQAMPYSERTRPEWPGWQRLSMGIPAGAPSDWSFWGEYRLVQLGTKRVLLFKSNTHLDWPGAVYLQQLVRQLIAEVQPALVLSVGTAGGARPTDHLGTVRAVSAGTLYQAGRPQASWPDYRNAWRASSEASRIIQAHSA
jgi:hypothetical protein